jgi:hypothetical protein
MEDKIRKIAAKQHKQNMSIMAICMSVVLIIEIIVLALYQ